MSFDPQKIAAVHRAGADTFLSLANASFESIERLTNLNMTAFRSAIEDSLTTTREILGANDAKEALALQASMAKPGVERAVAYSRSIYDISTRTNEEISKLLEDNIADMQAKIGSYLEKTAKAAPLGSEVAVAAIQSAFVGANSVYQNLSKAAKQAGQMAQSNIEAATNAAMTATRKKH